EGDGHGLTDLLSFEHQLQFNRAKLIDLVFCHFQAEYQCELKADGCTEQLSLLEHEVGDAAALDIEGTVGIGDRSFGQEHGTQVHRRRSAASSVRPASRHMLRTVPGAMSPLWRGTGTGCRPAFA